MDNNSASTHDAKESATSEDKAGAEDIAHFAYDDIGIVSQHAQNERKTLEEKLRKLIVARFIIWDRSVSVLSVNSVVQYVA